MGMVLLGASLWGSSSNCMEYLMTHQHFTWQAILLARMILTGLFFLGFCLYKKEPLLTPLRKEPWLMLKFTVLGMFVMQVPFVKAIYYSNAATATVLQYLMPALLLIMYLWKVKRRPRRREVVAVGLAILGTALIATKGQGAALAVSPETLFWGILGAFGMAWYTLYAAELLQRYSCFLIVGWGSLGNALLLELVEHPHVQGAIFNFDTLWSFGLYSLFGKHQIHPGCGNRYPGSFRTAFRLLFLYPVPGKPHRDGRKHRDSVHYHHGGDAGPEMISGRTDGLKEHGSVRTATDC